MILQANRLTVGHRIRISSGFSSDAFLITEIETRESGLIRIKAIGSGAIEWYLMPDEEVEVKEEATLIPKG